jgi:DNA replication licensing factor MCM5
LGRQLEAIIRISESLAKMTLTPVVQNHHVEEAIRLFKFSTMDAVSAGSADGLSRGELNEEMTRIEKELRRRLPIGWSTSYQSLVREFVTQQGFSSHALERTLFIMEKREIIRFSGQVSSTFIFCVILDLILIDFFAHIKKKVVHRRVYSLHCSVLPYMLTSF